MVIVRFDDPEAERRALGWLAGRFTFKSWKSGDLMVSEMALPYLAREGITFRVEGPATYDHYAPAVRNPAAAPV